MAKNQPRKNAPGTRSDEKAAAAQRRAARQEKAARQAEALKKEQEARKRKERLMVGGIVAAVLALIVGVTVYLMMSDNSVETSTPPAGAVDEYALAIGEEDAPHEVVVYEDFLCPACASFEAASGGPLAEAAEAGKVRVKYFPLNFLSRYGDYSERATNALAVVMEESGPEVAKEFHDSLFAEQPGEQGSLPDDDWLVEKAVAAGADEDAVRPGIEDMAFEGWVANATDDASKKGVRATPTVFLDGEEWDIADLAGLLEAID